MEWISSFSYKFLHVHVHVLLFLSIFQFNFKVLLCNMYMYIHIDLSCMQCILQMYMYMHVCVNIYFSGKFPYFISSQLAFQRETWVLVPFHLSSLPFRLHFHVKVYNHISIHVILFIHSCTVVTCTCVYLQNVCYYIHLVYKHVTFHCSIVIHNTCTWCSPLSTVIFPWFSHHSEAY